MFGLLGGVVFVLIGLDYLGHSQPIGSRQNVVEALLLPLGIFNVAVFGYALFRNR